MLILSKLIVKEWFRYFLGSVFILFILITAADLINGFIQGKDTERVLLEYSLKFPDLFSKLLPACCLVATLFSLNRLKGQAELISILASGYSFLRIYLLIGLCATSVSFIQFINLGYLGPYANKIKRQEIQKSRKSEGKYLTRSSIEGGRFWYKTQNYFASFSYFERKNNTLHDIEIYFFSPEIKAEKIIKALSATFVSEGQWLLKKVVELSELDTPTFPLRALVTEKMFKLNETPEDFGEFEADLTTLNFFNLKRFIKKLKKTGINLSEYEIILYGQISLSLSCFIFGLIPLSGIFTANRRSSSFGKNVVITLLISILFWVLYSSSLALGNSGSIPPLLATAIVPLGFFLFVLYTYWKNRRLSN